MTHEPAVADHYTHGSLVDALRRGVEAAGLTLDTVTAADLAPADEFHIGGRQATLAFIEQLGFGPDDHLLDVGCGIGGPARCFAEAVGCRVTGVDLTEEYIEAATALSEWVGLADRLAFHHGSALDLPLEDGALDGAYMIHVGMNIPDKASLFAEVARAVRPGGTFGVYDVMRTGGGDLAYPVPWAGTAATSFLDTPADYKAALAASGFEVIAERDRRDYAEAFFGAIKANSAKAGGPPPLGLHIVMGADTATKVANMIGNIEAGRIAPIEIVARRVN